MTSAICVSSIPEIISVLPDSTIRSEYKQLIDFHAHSITYRTHADTNIEVNSSKLVVR